MTAVWIVLGGLVGFAGGSIAGSSHAGRISVARVLGKVEWALSWLSAIALVLVFPVYVVLYILGVLEGEAEVSFAVPLAILGVGVVSGVASHLDNELMRLLTVRGRALHPQIVPLRLLAERIADRSRALAVAKAHRDRIAVSIELARAEREARDAIPDLSPSQRLQLARDQRSRRDLMRAIFETVSREEWDPPSRAEDPEGWAAWMGYWLAAQEEADRQA